MAPTTAHSSSISSAPTSSSKCGSNGIKKKFGCNFSGCGKSFSRSEHLNRHALNHMDGNETCSRCSAHFRRRDLLDRHMARHREKDDEAGGEGLGVLATRKRLWRDASGKIVNSRRPIQDGAKHRQISRPERKISKTSSTTNIPSCDFNIQPQPISSRAAAEQKQERNELDRPSISTTAPLLEYPAKLSPTSTSEHFEFSALYEDRTWPSPHDPSQLALPNTHTTSTSSSPISSLKSPTLESPYSPPSCSPQPFRTYMGAIAELPSDYIFNPEAGLCEWQAWSQFLVSRCREEKFGGGEERVWVGPVSDSGSLDWVGTG